MHTRVVSQLDILDDPDAAEAVGRRVFDPMEFIAPDRARDPIAFYRGRIRLAGTKRAMRFPCREHQTCRTL